MPQQMHPQIAVGMGQLLQRLAGNPKTRARTLGLVKEIAPSYQLPADVAVADLETRLRDERRKEKEEENKLRMENQRKNQRKKLLDSYDEKQVKEIEETVMKKYPALNYEDAAKIYASENGPTRTSGRPDAPKFRHGQIWEFPDIPGLLQNPDKAATDMAYAVIDEIHAGR